MGNNIKNIIFIGDSVTDSGRDKSLDSKDLGHGYAALIAAKVGADYPEKNYSFLNKGVGGNKIVQLFGRWTDDVINQNPYLVNIMIGVNDAYGEYSSWKNGVETNKFRNVYHMLIDELKTKHPNCKIVITEPFVELDALKNLAVIFSDLTKAREDLAEKQQVAKEIAKEYGFTFVPLQEIFDNAKKNGVEGSYWVADGLHPTIFGHELIARQWLSIAYPTLLE